MSKKEETSSPSLKRSWFQELKAEFGKITWPTKGQARETVCGCNRDFRNSRIYHCRCGLPVTDRFNLYCWLGR